MRFHFIARLLFLLAGHLTGNLSQTVLSDQTDSDKSFVVEGIVGESISLPCVVEAPHGDRVAVILWYRTHHPDALYTYDARSPGHHQHSSRSPGLRATFYADPPARLVFPRATTKLAGDYECRVDYVHATSATTKIKVVMVELPLSIHIIASGENVLKQNLVANLGEQLNLLCQVIGGRPKPRVWWTLSGQVIHSSSFTNSSDYLEHHSLSRRHSSSSSTLTETNLRVEELTRDHQGAPLTCHASNANVSAISLRKTIIINLNTPPSDVSVSGLPPVMKVGGKYRAWCSAPDSEPPPVLIWSLTRLGKEPKQLARQELRERNVSRSWYDIVTDWRDNEANLTCAAMSPNLPLEIVKNSTQLNVQFSPRVRLSLGAMLQADNIIEGRDVYFRCDVQSNPPPNRIAWFHNGQEVHADGHVIVSSDHLVLQKVHRKWSGLFECSASNRIGENKSNSLQISIQYAPVCGRSHPVVQYASLGENVTLLCRVLANPTNLTFQWTFTNTAMQSNSSLSRDPPVGFHTQAPTPPPMLIPSGEKSAEGLQGKLQYTLLKPQDFGNVQCIARNSVGTQTAPCVFAVKPTDILKSSFSCKVTKQTWESVEILCGKQKAAVNLKDGSNKRGDSKFPNVLTNPNSIRGMSILKNSGHNKWTQSKDISDPTVAEEVRDNQLLPDKHKKRPEGEYLLTVRERDSGSLIHNTSGVEGDFNLTGLTPGADYVIKVWRMEEGARSAPHKLETFTLRTAENKMKENQSNAAMAGILAAVVGMAIIITIVVVVVVISRANSRHTAGRSQFVDEDSFQRDYKMSPEEAVSSTGRGLFAQQNSEYDEKYLSDFVDDFDELCEDEIRTEFESSSIDRNKGSQKTPHRRAAPRRPSNSAADKELTPDRSLSPKSTLGSSYSMKPEKLTKVFSRDESIPDILEKSSNEVNFPESCSSISEILRHSSESKFKSSGNIVKDDSRSHYVRTPKTTLVIQERESFL